MTDRHIFGSEDNRKRIKRQTNTLRVVIVIIIFIITSLVNSPLCLRVLLIFSIILAYLQQMQRDSETVKQKDLVEKKKPYVEDRLDKREK